jgi:hypothetical protein
MAMSETNAGGVRRRSVETVVPVHNEAHVLDLPLEAGLGARFSDARCGFRTVRTDVFRALAPHIEDTAWFFDTELPEDMSRMLRTAPSAVRTPAPTVLPTGANTPLEYAS